MWRSGLGDFGGRAWDAMQQCSARDDEVSCCRVVGCVGVRFGSVRGCGVMGEGR